MAREKAILSIEHSPAVYRSTRTFGWFGVPRYLYPGHAKAALLEVFPWEALVLAVMAAAVLWVVVGPQEAGGLGVCVALALVTTQMLLTRSFLTPRRLVRRTGLLFTRRVVDLPLSSISAVRVVADPAVHEDFGDVIVETGERAYRFCAVSGATRVASVIRAHATDIVSDDPSL